jgi:cytochrome c556
MNAIRQVFTGCVAAALGLLAACTGAEAPKPPSAAGSGNAAAVRSVATLQDLMAGQIMPAADALWGATGSTSDETGVHDNAPKTDDDWKKLRRSAVTLIEACNLMLSERRKIAPVELPADPTSNSLGSRDIDQLLDTNWAGFTGFVVAMRNVGETMLKAIDERNLDAISDAGGTLDEVCEACHKVFWYPEPKK